MYDEPTATKALTTEGDTPFGAAMRDLVGALDRAEKTWELVAMRLTQFMGEGEPENEAPVRALAVGTSTATIELRRIVARLDEWTDRMERVRRRLEL